MAEDSSTNSRLSTIIRARRTRKPVSFKDAPHPSKICELIDIARHAPNHHRTEPARFYLLDEERIKQVGQMFGETIQGDGKDPLLAEKGEKKAREWGSSPGLLIVTSSTDLNSKLVRKNPESAMEDYATVCCICQNLLILMEEEKISSKWSTGPVWNHPDFAKTVGLKNPSMEKVVALIFYGFCDQSIDARLLAPIDEQLVNHCSSTK